MLGGRAFREDGRKKGDEGSYEARLGCMMAIHLSLLILAIRNL